MDAFVEPLESASAGTVILVDDDDDVRAAITFALEVEGFSVLGYESAEQALRLADLGDCRCFVIDQRLPGLDGLSLYITLRARGAGVPGLLITSSPTADLRARASAVGMRLIEKPMLEDELARIVALLSGNAAD